MEHGGEGRVRAEREGGEGGGKASTEGVNKRRGWPWRKSRKGNEREIYIEIDGVTIKGGERRI